jgi:hypothetical protein
MSIAPESAVVIQCVVQKTTVVALYQPVFCDVVLHGEERLCSDVAALTVFSDATHLTEHSRFVGVVASLQNYHGEHAHISVFVRGAVTMACDLEVVRTLRPMATLAFDPTRINPNCFVGLPASFRPATIIGADPQSCDRVIGTLLAIGRQPTNEIRLILRPNDGYCNTRLDFMRSIAARDTQSEHELRAPHFTLAQVDNILQHYDDELHPSSEADTLLVLISRVTNILQNHSLEEVCAASEEQ